MFHISIIKRKVCVVGSPSKQQRSCLITKRGDVACKRVTVSVDNKLVFKLRLSSAALSEVTLEVSLVREAACFAAGVSPDIPATCEPLERVAWCLPRQTSATTTEQLLEYLDCHHITYANPPQRPPIYNTNFNNPDETLPASPSPWPFKVSSIPQIRTANMVSSTIPMPAAAYHQVANNVPVLALLNKYDPPSPPPSLPTSQTILTKEPQTAAPA